VNTLHSVYKQSLFSLPYCVRCQSCLYRQLFFQPFWICLVSCTYLVNNEVYFLRQFCKWRNIVFPLLITEKAGYLISCTGLIKGEIFRSSIISLASVFIPHTCVVTTNRINILRSHVQRLLFYANFNQTRRVSTNFGKILNGNFMKIHRVTVKIFRASGLDGRTFVRKLFTKCCAKAPKSGLSMYTH
jgi:hypothetical protein